MPAERTPRARILALAAFAVAGAIAGYIMHRVIGCPGGGCPITGNPWVSTLYGLVVGLVLGTGFRPARRLR
jgi:hypothetical protein